MRLHALEGMDEETTASHVNGTLLGDDAALDAASGPEGVSHLSPGSLGVCAERAGAVLADDETRGASRELEVDDASGVCAGLDVV